MGMISIWSLIQSFASVLLPMVYMAIVIIFFIMWGIQTNHPYKPNVMEPDRHIYYPFRYNLKFKVFLILTLFGFVCVILPLGIGVLAHVIFGFDSMIAGGIVAAIGLIINILVIAHSFKPKIESVVVDKRGITIKRENEDDEFYPVSLFEHYIIPTKNQAFRLVFNEDGTKKEVYLPWLCVKDLIRVGDDLSYVRKNGVLPGSAPSPKPQAKPEPKAPTQQIQTAQDDLRSDPVKYDAYLRGVLDKMNEMDKSIIVGYLKRDDKMQAIKECRERTGVGLIYARDLVERYMTKLDVEVPKSQTKDPDEELMKESLAEIEELVADKPRYHTFLSECLFDMPVEDRSAVMNLTDKGELVMAIKECRDRTGLGLRFCKDLVQRFLSFPDLGNYKARIYLKDTYVTDIENLLREYDDIYSDEKPQIEKIDRFIGTTWCYIELKNERNTFWHYVNLVLWMSQCSKTLFGYAIPVKNNADMIIIHPDFDDPLGEACDGVMNNCYFNFNVPDHFVTWREEIEQEFDPQTYLSQIIKDDLRDIEHELIF